MTPIDKAARALALSQSGVDEFDALDDAMQETIREHVRAVQEALREIPEEAAASLRREFGYAPQASDGEQWTVFEDRVLIVIHPTRKPRLYKRGALDERDYIEIEPLW